MSTKRENDKKSERKRMLKLDWKDYVAITIAALQSTLLPMVLLLFVLVIVTLLVVLLVFR